MPDESVKIPVSIEEEMRKSYMDYAMSVIIGRAIPDARDGLKPVHRRILYAMHDLGNTHDKPYKKSARVVGDVIGKYHPHGDVAVYDSLVRMAQDFSMRYPLVDGQGNFGSIDGDPPAAMRYTEVRMTRLTGALLADIEKETVDFGPNYDESAQEPRVLPAAFPNLLVNGSSGIAVGMATNIPPHNLREAADALIMLINNPEVTVAELMEAIPGPDFPTAGFIYGREGIRQAYETGRGSLQLRANAFVEKHPRTGKESIVISELPYQVNKAKLVERIAELMRDGTIQGISDLRDESDREGIRVVLELKKEEVAQAILNNLYKLTPMQTTFGIIQLAIVHNQPRLLNLKETLGCFLEHRKEVVRRRTAFDLKKARERAHILAGLKIALENLDAIIQLIRRAESPAAAKAGLMERFRLSEIQAQAILDMRLQRLTQLERDKVLEEHRETLRSIKAYEEILASEQKILQIIAAELNEIKEKYGDERRTVILDETAEISLEDMIVEEDMIVTISHFGYIKRNPLELYRSQRRGGKGKTGMAIREEDFVEDLFVASSRDYILCFTSQGRVYWLKVYDIPQAGRAARGKPIVNLLNLGAEEKVTALLPVRTFEEDKEVIVATRKGVIKKTPLVSYSRPRSGGIIALTLEEGDELIGARVGSGNKTIFLAAKGGKAIRFKEEQVRSMGRAASGVKGVTLSSGDELVGLELLTEGTTVFTATERGYGKRSLSHLYPIHRRGGKGVVTVKITPRNGSVVGILQVTDEDDVMLVTNTGRVIRIKAATIPTLSRGTQGVKLMELEAEERIVGVARLAEEEESAPEQ